MSISINMFWLMGPFRLFYVGCLWALYGCSLSIIVDPFGLFFVGKCGPSRAIICRCCALGSPYMCESLRASSDLHGNSEI